MMQNATHHSAIHLAQKKKMPNASIFFDPSYCASKDNNICCLMMQSEFEITKIRNIGKMKKLI